eukprot:1249122-Prymnesium_polylepis.1
MGRGGTPTQKIMCVQSGATISAQYPISPAFVEGVCGREVERSVFMSYNCRSPVPSGEETINYLKRSARRGA